MKRSRWRWTRLVLPLALLCGLSGSPVLVSAQPPAPPAQDEFSAFDQHLLGGTVTDPRCVPAPGMPAPLMPSPTTPMPPSPTTPEEQPLPPPTPDQTLMPEQPTPTTAPAQFPQIAALDAGAGVLGGRGRVPAMIGDFFGGPGTFPATIQATNRQQPFTVQFPAVDGIATNPLNPAAGQVLLPFGEIDFIDTQTGQSVGTLGPVNFISRANVGTINQSWLDNVNRSTAAGQNIFIIVPNQDGSLNGDNFVVFTNDAQFARDLSELAQNLFRQDGFVAIRENDLLAGEVAFVQGSQDGVLTLGDGNPNTLNGDLMGIYIRSEFTPLITVQIPTGAVTGRTKVAENTSPIPRDRIFFNYSHFNNVPLTAGGLDVNRYTPGFEKTFFDGMASVELRVPFATTIDSDITVDDSGSGQVFGNNGAVEFGDVTIYPKVKLFETDDFLLSGGLGVRVPTADDIRVGRTDGADLFRIDNERVALLPFLGAVFAPSERLFTQAFVQLDVDVNGNPVSADLDPNNLGVGPGGGVGGLTDVGRLNDPTFLYVDWSIGYWMYRDETPWKRGITGFAPMFELHYNRSLTDTDSVTFPIQDNLGNTLANFRVGEELGNIEILNAVFGATAEFGKNTYLTAAYVTPMAGGIDKEFDGELRVIFNHIFGPRGLLGALVPPGQ